MTSPIETWLRTDPEPALIGTRCATCSTVHFPPQTAFCRNPGCDGEQLDETPLSTRGTVWSWTRNEYDPPAPAAMKAPYSVAAVELAAERMIVLGLVDGDEPLQVGQEVTLTVGPVSAEDPTPVWKWRPA